MEGARVPDGVRLADVLLDEGDEQTGVVAAWLAGSDVPEGLVVDQDLRWELLIGLVAAGRAGEAEIAAEEGRDRTTTGRERAAQARACVPTPEAKAAARSAWGR